MFAGDAIPSKTGIGLAKSAYQKLTGDRVRRGSQRARCDNVSFDPRDKLLVIAEPT